MRVLKKKILAFFLVLSLSSTAFMMTPSMQITAQASSKKVYIAASGNGKCYHKSKYCSRMRGRVKKIKKSTAKKWHYRACKKCY